MSSDAYDRLVQTLGSHGITGGQVYDALVGALANDAAAVLVTRDERAKPTYEALGVRVSFVG